MLTSLSSAIVNPTQDLPVDLHFAPKSVAGRFRPLTLSQYLLGICPIVSGSTNDRARRVANTSTIVDLSNSKPYQHGAGQGLSVSILWSINDGSRVAVGIVIWVRERQPASAPTSRLKVQNQTLYLPDHIDQAFRNSGDSADLIAHIPFSHSTGNQHGLVIIISKPFGIHISFK